MKKRAFTLIEILVVIAVVGLLIAIALPVMASAKKSAYKATTISNLRQCASAALLYEGDYGDIPNNTGALEAFAKVPDCDHADYWRPGCRIQFGEPLVGSYGYIRSVEFFKDEELWDQYRSGLPNFPMFAAIWYSDHRLVPFRGSAPPIPCPGDDEGCMFPDRIFYAMHDGSIKNWTGKKYVKRDDGQEVFGWAFTWSNVFNREIFASSSDL